MEEIVKQNKTNKFSPLTLKQRVSTLRIQYFNPTIPVRAKTSRDES